MSTRLYRYFFHGWMFRDADSGTSLERSAARRHNAREARWLPLYMLRWAVLGTILLGVESACERLSASPVLCAALAVALIYVVLFEMITAICWAFLRSGGRSR